MSTPRVSVIMPVFNTATYLGEAITSILTQSFSDFELIIINDGSTDDSQAVIRSFHDMRIIYLENEKNMGLVYTLNRAIDAAKGEWIARMDGDDISLPGRFGEQLLYLARHPEVDVLACRVQLIDESGNETTNWLDDVTAITPEQIMDHLAVDNCIAHPSVMIRTDVLKTYRYLPEQSQAEDYDLWLRLVTTGKIIHKLDKILVKHRIISSSFTRVRQQNVYAKLAETKFRFVAYAKKNGIRGSLVRKVYINACMDKVLSWIKPLKRRIWGTGS
ncbi:MAG TPA: glycosyltransferase [Chitinophagaceae bacterium]|nr:glycosyltransferase [Chitinophagaceae bacterium]